MATTSKIVVPKRPYRANVACSRRFRRSRCGPSGQELKNGSSAGNTSLSTARPASGESAGSKCAELDRLRFQFCRAENGATEKWRNGKSREMDTDGERRATAGVRSRRMRSSLRSECTCSQLDNPRAEWRNGAAS